LPSVPMMLQGIVLTIEKQQRINEFYLAKDSEFFNLVF